MPQVSVSAVDRFLRYGNRNVMLFGILDGIFSSGDVPLPPGGNNIECRIEGKECKLKPNLQTHSRKGMGQIDQDIMSTSCRMVHKLLMYHTIIPDHFLFQCTHEKLHLLQLL